MHSDGQTDQRNSRRRVRGREPIGVTLMLGHRIKGSRTLDVFRQFKQLRLLVLIGWSVGNL